MDNHIILVRFNQVFDPNKNLYEGSPSWMEHRINLFKEYTLKSLISQSDKEYHLFLLSDPNTPDFYKKELDDLKNTLPQIEILYTNEYKGNYFEDLVKQKYISKRKNTSNKVILSRCDNDDLVSIHYNYLIKLALQNEDKISLMNGLTFDIITKQINIFNFPSSPFVSIKSSLDNIINPLSINHHDIGAIPIKTDYPVWCWVIHDKNAHNTMKGMPSNLQPLHLNQLFGYE